MGEASWRWSWDFGKPCTMTVYMDLPDALPVGKGKLCDPEAEPGDLLYGVTMHLAPGWGPAS